jgi:hypothetical protein
MITVASKTQNVWGFRFDQVPPYSAINLEYEYPGTSRERATCLKTYHSSPLPYIFGDVKALDDATEEDRSLSNYMIER